MVKKVSSVIIKNWDGYYLLQFRDSDAPSHKNKWSIFGGHLEAGESPVEAAKRELLEELGIDFAIERFNFLGDAAFSDGEGNDVLLYLFYLSIKPEEKIKLGEGGGYGFFTKEAIAGIPTPEPLRNIVEKYF